jgi:hypothetical protein
VCGQGWPHLHPQKLSDFWGVLRLRGAGRRASRGGRIGGRTDCAVLSSGASERCAGGPGRTLGRTTSLTWLF